MRREHWTIPVNSKFFHVYKSFHSYLCMSGCPKLSRDPCSRNHQNQRWLSQFCKRMANVQRLLAYLGCVVHLHPANLPVAGLGVLLQPRLSGKKATQSEHLHARQEGEETALPADVLPGQHRQPLPREGPPHRLIVQAELLGLPGPRF